MKLARMLSLLTGALLACQSFVALAEAGANSKPDVATAAANAHPTTPPNNGLWIHESLQGLPEGTTDSKAISLTLPAGAQVGSLKAVLNGTDVSTSFRAVDCTGSEGV